MPILIISLLKNNWQWFVGAAVVFMLFYSVYSLGYEHADDKCKADKVAAMEELQAEKDRLADEANKQAKELEVQLSSERENSKKLKGQVYAERKKNKSYDDCIISDTGLQLLNSTVRKTSPAR